MNRSKRKICPAPTRGGHTRYAQAFITTCNLPDTLERLLASVGDDPWASGTLVDNILEFEPGERFTWTAPAGVATGDVAFFHYAARAKARVVTLRRAAERAGMLDRGLVDFLGYAAAQAAQYAGRIFAYGILAGPAEPEQPVDGADHHWRSRLYAPFASVELLDEPLLISDHTDFLTQPTRTITELTPAQFGALKERLVSEGNGLDVALATAVPGRDDFGGISPPTWRDIACRPEQQFRVEADVRGYFADYLLDELKDAGTTVHSETRCVAAQVRRRTGTAAGRCGPRPDYVMRFGGRWMPVEAKLSVWSWPDIIDQVTPYMDAVMYEARLSGGEAVRLPAGRGQAPTACLIIDQDGVYLVREHAFYKSGPGYPLWSRADLARRSAASLRRELLALGEG